MIRLFTLPFRAALAATFCFCLWQPAIAQDEAQEAADAEETPAVDVAESDADAMTPEELEHQQIMLAYGYMVGRQSGLYIGFSDEELNGILYGIIMAARGQSVPENFEELIPKMDKIMKARVEAYNEGQEKVISESVSENKAAGDAFMAELVDREGIKKTASGIYYEMIDEGIGRIPSGNDIVRVNYTGTLIDGTVFDASEAHGGPVDFPLQGVIPGFTQGLQLVREGGKIRIYVPPYLGYGDSPSGNIPPGSTLIFDIELVEVNPVDPQFMEE